MVGEQKAREIAATILKVSEADATEVVLLGATTALTRFAQSVIHQSMAEDGATAHIRVVAGSKVGRVSTNMLDVQSLRVAVRRAMEQARRSVETPFAGVLASPAPFPHIEAYDAETASYSPAARAEQIARIVRISGRYGFSASGAFTTSTEELMVANSLRLAAYTQSTFAALSTVIASTTSNGYADAYSRRVRDIDAGAVAQLATDKCLNCLAPADLEAGEYEVILEPKAVSTLLSFFGMLGFGARSFREGRSFVSGNLGKQIVGENISIWDDGRDERGMAMPFDFEGVPKQRLDLVANGIASGVCYDLETAAEAGTVSTGHGLPPDARQYTSDPLPSNLFLATGDATLEEMITSIKRGLLVTRFHYTNIVHPLKAIITGMTRDGTFLIENGRVVGGVRNLRFTQSILEALRNVQMIGKSPILEADDYFGASLVPALKIGRFNFTGVTEH